MDSRWTRLWQAAQGSCSGPGIEGSWQRRGWPRRSGPAPGALSTVGTGLGWPPSPPPPPAYNTSPLPKCGSFPFLDPWDAVQVGGYTSGAQHPRQCWEAQRSKVRGISANTSRGNGSLGQAQFGEASGEAEELLAQTEKTWGVGREMGPVRGWAVATGIAKSE